MMRYPNNNIFKQNPVFKNFLLACTVSLFGTNVFDISMPLYILSHTHSAISLSLTYVGMHLPYFIMAPLTGYMIDHINKRKLLMAADLGQLLCMGFLLFYDLSPQHSLLPILLTIFASKTLMNCFETVATFQLIPSLVPKQSLSEANTWFLSAQRMIQIIGPLSGGILFAVLGIRICILINLLSFGATFFYVYRLKNLNEIIASGVVAQDHFNPTFKAIYENFLQSVDFIWRSRLFRRFILLMFFWNLSPLCPNSPTLVYYFTEYCHFSSSKYGVVAALIGTISILGFVISRSLYFKFHFFQTFVGACLWQAVFATLSVLTFQVPVVLALLFAISRAGGATLSIGTFLLRQTEIPRAQSGGINACLRMFFMSAAPLSAILQGFIIHHYGSLVSMGFGCLCLWGTVVFARKVALAYLQHSTEVPPGKTAASVQK